VDWPTVKAATGLRHHEDATAFEHDGASGYLR
jgi:hypothetical protein